MAACTVTTLIDAPLQLVWDCFTQPEHITQWNQADESWHCPNSVNDLREGGRFSATMAAKDGSTKFDFTGTYTLVEPLTKITYRLDDDRMVSVVFTVQQNGVLITETFETENVYSHERQRAGWQAILDSFGRHVMSQKIPT